MDSKQEETLSWSRFAEGFGEAPVVLRGLFIFSVVASLALPVDLALALQGVKLWTHASTFLLASQMYVTVAFFVYLLICLRRFRYIKVLSFLLMAVMVVTACAMGLRVVVATNAPVPPAWSVMRPAEVTILAIWGGLIPGLWYGLLRSSQVDQFISD